MSALIDATDDRLSTHEQFCDHRYEAIKKSFESGSKRMTKLEYLLYAVIAAVLLGPGVAAEMVKKILGM